jgi:hypothetical protein
MAMFGVATLQRSFPLPVALGDDQSSSGIPEASLSVNLPSQSYRIAKTVFVPFDPRVSHDGKFNSLRDALIFIGTHCVFHHKLFSRSLAKMYMAHCRVLNVAKGGYAPLVHVSKREFDAAFSAATRHVAWLSGA